MALSRIKRKQGSVEDLFLNSLNKAPVINSLQSQSSMNVAVLPSLPVQAVAASGGIAGSNPAIYVSRLTTTFLFALFCHHRILCCDDGLNWVLFVFKLEIAATLQPPSLAKVSEENSWGILCCNRLPQTGSPSFHCHVWAPQVFHSLPSIVMDISPSIAGSRLMDLPISIPL